MSGRRVRRSSPTECDGVPVVCVKLLVIGQHGSVIPYPTVDFDPTHPVSRLKEDMADVLSMAAHDQVWRYKKRVIEDFETLNDVQVDPDDTIEVTRRAQPY